MGGVKYCPVRGCTSVKPETRFFHVPTDLETRYKWMRLCGFGSISKKSSICELHFLNGDFYNNENGKKKLRRKILPSQNLPGDTAAALNTHLMLQTSAKKSLSVLDERMGKPVQSAVVPFLPNVESELVAKLRNLIAEMKTEKITLLKKITNLKMQNSKLRKHALLKKDLYSIFKKHLGKYFTDTQIKAYIRGDWKLIRNWSVEDFKRARILHFLSKRAYQYLRKSNILPLPSLTTLYKASPNGLASSELQQLVDKYGVDDDEIEKTLEADMRPPLSPDEGMEPAQVRVVAPEHFHHAQGMGHEEHVQHVHYVEHGEIPIFIAEGVTGTISVQEGTLIIE